MGRARFNPIPRQRPAAELTPSLTEGVRYRVVPLSLSALNDFVARLHRHHKPVQGHRFSIGAVDESGVLRGGASIGRPTSRMVDANSVLEVTRLVTDGSKNACSFLYGRAARIGREMGYSKIQTYILESEPATSLRAAGWHFETMSNRSGFHKHRKDGLERRVDDLGLKQRWALALNGPRCCGGPDGTQPVLSEPPPNRAIQ